MNAPRVRGAMSERMESGGVVMCRAKSGEAVYVGGQLKIYERGYCGCERRKGIKVHERQR